MTDIKRIHTPYAFEPMGLLDPRPAKAPFEAASAELDETEARTYGGIAANRLAALCLSWIAALTGLFETARQRKLSDLKDGLDPALLKAAELYMSIKTALTKMNAPITMDMHAGVPANTQRRGESSFRWDVSPSDYYNWAERTEHSGYDPRGTSAEWIIRRARNLRAQATKFTRTEIWRSDGLLADEVRPARPREAGHQQGGAFDFTPVREFVPVEAEFDYIWPPITLERPKLDVSFKDGPNGEPAFKKRITRRRKWQEPDAAQEAVRDDVPDHGPDNHDLPSDMPDIKSRASPNRK